jgi:fermentation-respiration switch protein FrsA (DUF1100 family)
MSPAIPLLAVLAAAFAPPPGGTETFEIRGARQELRLIGTPGGPVAVIASSDGGWIHLAPQVAGYLAAKGWYVIGFDCKAYLASFTHDTTTLAREDVPRDFAVLLRRAMRETAGQPVVLIGVSEGAGLAVLAASSPEVQPLLRGVVGLGLTERNELGWRFRDQIIYLTHGVPNEPLFDVSEIVSRVAPVPLAVIASTHDAFVPLDVIRRITDRAAEPKRLWVVEAQNHNFAGNVAGLHQRLDEALAWIATVAQRPAPR